MRFCQELAKQGILHKIRKANAFFTEHARILTARFPFVMVIRPAGQDVHAIRIQAMDLSLNLIDGQGSVVAGFAIRIACFDAVQSRLDQMVDILRA